jgi:site-specific recombinase XerC
MSPSTRTPRTPKSDALTATADRPTKRATVDDARCTAAYLAGLNTDIGRRGAVSSLRRVAAALGVASIDAIPWRAVTVAHVRAMLAAIGNTLTKKGTPPAPATVALALAVVKGCIRAGWDLGHVDGDTAARIRAVKPPRGSRLPAGRNVSQTERNRLIAATTATDGPHALRDVAMLAVAATTGLRIAELAALRTADVTVDGDAIRLRIIGKGNAERINVLRNGQRRALGDWLAVRGDVDGAVFCRIAAAGTITAERMTTQAVHMAIQRRAAAAGIGHITVHDLRRTVAGDLLDAGTDIATVSRWLGHASPTTTARYDRRGDRAINDAAGALHIDYPGRRK